MLLYQVKYSIWMAIFIPFFVRSQDSRTNSTNFHATNLQLEPEFVILNSSTTFNFLCSKHVYDGIPFGVDISRKIPANKLQISQIPLNTSTIQIRLQTTNYVGTFHLFCYSKDMENKGTRADVVVVAPSGTLQLAERCRVYDKQFIKCIIRAPIIASAIQEGFVPKFDFTEVIRTSESPRYNTRYELLTNESTHESLTFRWKPNVDGQFPNGLIMNMTAMLAHFVPTSYWFDMTPIFKITPKFLLRVLSSTALEMQFTLQSPTPICEKSITQLAESIESRNRTWTLIESNRMTILINDLLPRTIYRVCMKCREQFEDPSGDEVCHDATTYSKYAWLLTKETMIMTVAGMGVAGVLILVLLYLLKRLSKNRRRNLSKDNDHLFDSERPITRYEIEPRPTNQPIDQLINQQNHQQRPLLPNGDDQFDGEREVDILFVTNLPRTRSVGSQSSNISGLNLASNDDVVGQSSPTDAYLPLFSPNSDRRH